MKREKRTTKKERKALSGGPQSGGLRRANAAARPGHDHTHIHCVACGVHLEPALFGEPGGPSFYRCQHGGDFAHCAGCAEKAKQLVDEHDRTGKPVQKAALWH